MVNEELTLFHGLGKLKVAERQLTDIPKCQAASVRSVESRHIKMFYRGEVAI